jgi:HlyD family secretion protein
MDIVRVRRRPHYARFLIPIAIVALVAAAGWSLFTSFLRPHAVEPAVDRTSLVTDVVQRKPFSQSIRASGQLASERVFAISVSSDGVVATLPIRPGTVITPQTVVATLTNPDLEAAVIDANAQLRAAEADLASVREQAKGAHLDLIAAQTSAVAQAGESRYEAEAERKLYEQGFVGSLIYRKASIEADAAHDLVAIAKEKVRVDAVQSQAKIAAAEARVEQLRAQVAANEQRLTTLTVRAGAAGVVQSVAVETGARLSSGAQIAQVADQRDLKAVLDVPEAQAHAVSLGMPTSILVQNENVDGHVTRINPAAQNGTVAVDVTPDRGFPNGARPDSNVDGTIRLGAARIALSVARPTNAADGGSVDLYRVVDGGTRAVRTHVTFGVGSDDRITIASGLTAGETVIISDMSAVNNAPSVRIQ